MAFHLHRNGTSTVFELHELRDMARRGDLPQDEYVYVDDKGEWLAANVVPELNGAWNIEETEATVAVQLTPELLASMAGLEPPAAMAVPTPKAVESMLAAKAVESAPPAPVADPEPAPVSPSKPVSPSTPAVPSPPATPAPEDEDSIPTTFMQVPEELRAPSTKAVTGQRPSVKVALPHTRVDDDEPATAYMEAISLPPAPAPAQTAVTPTPQPANRTGLYIGIGIGVIAVLLGLIALLANSK